MDGTNTVTVSIVIPCRNEERHIVDCLDSIMANDFPGDDVEVYVIDGMSTDQTRELVRKYTENHPGVKLLDNPKKITPAALNIGIKESNGKYITVLSSHSKVEKNFVRANVDSLEKYNVECVGGILKTLPTKSSRLAQAIAIALSHPFGIGNSYFRIGSKEPIFVDTVPFGCYRKEVFKKIGFFDEDLIRNQDDEFNFRLIKNGGRVLLIPEIVSFYYARDSLYKLWKMYFFYGFLKPLVALKVGAILTWRQLMPAFFISITVTFGILSLKFPCFQWPFFMTIFFYSFVNVVCSFFIAMSRGLKYLLVLPVIFPTIHFSYGLGYLKGVFDFILLKKHRKKKIEDIPLSR